jgi:hypothetical protein
MSDSDTYNVRTLRRTSLFCPSQWEGQTIDGKEIYIRYRYGTLEFWVASKAGTRIDWQPEELIIAHKVGDEYAGALSCENMRFAISMLLPDKVILPEKCEGEIDQDSLNEKVTASWEKLSDLISSGGIKVIPDQEASQLDPKENLFLTADRQTAEEYALRGYDTADTSQCGLLGGDVQFKVLE